MRKYVAFLLVGLIATSAFAISEGDTVAISVREAGLRGIAGFLAPIQSELSYGTSVTVLSVRGDWVEIRDEGAAARGWVHASSVQAPEDLNLTGDRTDGSISTAEVALAGRGFSEQVEREYREQEALNYGHVDAMETLLLPYDEIGAFLRDIDARVAGGAE